MGLQEVPCAHSSIFFMGLYKIKEYVERSQFILQNVIGQYVIGFDDEDVNNWDWDNWDKLQRAFHPFVIQKNIPQVGVSKFYEDDSFGASDGSKSPTRITNHHGACVHVYEILRDLNLLKDSNAMKISFDYDPDEQIENTKIWMSIFSSYETILSLMESLYILAYSIAPMYHSPRQRMLSPYQIDLYKSDLMDIEWLIDRNYVRADEADQAAYHRIYWGFIDDSFPNLIHALRNDYWGNFIRISINTIDFSKVKYYFTYKYIGAG